LISNTFALSLSDEGYSRNPPSALNLISAFLLHQPEKFK